MTRLKLLLLGILRKIDQSRRSKYQNTTRNEYYIMAKSRRFCRGLRCILRVKKWRRSENFDGVGILRICGVTARSHIRLPTSTFTRYRDLSISCLLLLGSSSAPPQYSLTKLVNYLILEVGNQSRSSSILIPVK